jgi:hypothetical protein
MAPNDSWTEEDEEELSRLRELILPGSSAEWCLDTFNFALTRANHKLRTEYLALVKRRNLYGWRGSP